MEPFSLTGKRWQVRQDFRPCTGTPVDISRRILGAIAAERDLDGELTDDETFGTPDTAFPNLGKAVDRIRSAVTKGERIGVFGDYDCDGITAVAQLVRYFRRHGAHPWVRLPHRLTEGYGLRPEIIKECEAAGVTLLLTVDTGVAAAAEIALAQERGIDVIIVDHHHIPATLPPAYAVLHPGLGDSRPPHPAAAGVAFVLVRALEEATDWEDRETDIALAAMGTVADLVELRGDNRTLVRRGLLALQRTRDIGLVRLMAQAGVTETPTSRDIGYRLAPRINAAGRMDEPGIALRGLLGDETSLAMLETLNQQRQTETIRLTTEAMQIASRDPSPFLFILHPEYPAGLLGLIAGKLTEALGKPSLVAGVRGDTAVASLRSIPAFHVTQALETAKDSLLTFGGHAQAAGCTFRLDAADALRQTLIDHASERLSPDDLRPLLTVDGIVNADQVSRSLCDGMRALEPFGQGNAEPRFLIPGMTLSELRVVGRDATHLQARAGHLKAVGFGLGAMKDRITGPMDVVCRLGVDTWQGVARPQLFLEDLRLSFSQTGAKFPSISNTSGNGVESAVAIL